MGTSEHIFVDSNYFVSLFNPNDSRNHHARLIAEKLEHNANQLVLSNLHFLEIVTVLSQRKGRQAAREAGAYLISSPHIKILHIDIELHEESWKLFCETHQKDISFIDCSTLVAMKAEGIDILLTFDAHFKKLQKHSRFSLYH